MFTNHPAVLLGEFLYELFHAIFDRDPHGTSGSELEILLCLFPGNEIAICVNLIEVPFQHSLLVFGNEISYGITEGFSRRFYIRECRPCTWSQGYPLVCDFHLFAFCLSHVFTSSRSEYNLIFNFLLSCTTVQT